MRIKVAIFSVAVALVLLVSPAFAQGGKPSPLPTPRHSLTQGSLKACQAREETVKTRMNSLVKLATNIEDKFDAIAKRVEDFYTNTVLPGGKTLSNYDALLSDISTKKAMVQTDLTSAQDKLNAFSCTTDDPKSLLMQFRLDMMKVKNDLKLYRTSIKNLIVAVRPLAPKATEKPEATETPEATPTSTP